MDSEKELSLVETLAGLTDKRFAEVFYAAARKRPSEEDEGHFVLGHCYRQDEGSGWQLACVAPHDRKEYPGWVDDAPLCQEGECGRCGARFVSWAKRCTCPVCGAQVYGT